MIQKLLVSSFMSRSFWDLLLIWAGYSLGWGLHITCAHWLVNFKTSLSNRLCAGVLLGAICLLIKGFLPPVIFEGVILFCFACTLKLTGLNWIKAIIGALAIDALVLISDLVIIQPVLYIPGAAVFITKTSLGLAAGTMLEPIIPVFFIFFLKRGVKRWRTTRFRNL